MYRLLTHSFMYQLLYSITSFTLSDQKNRNPYTVQCNSNRKSMQWINPTFIKLIMLKSCWYYVPPLSNVQINQTHIYIWNICPIKKKRSITLIWYITSMYSRSVLLLDSPCFPNIRCWLLRYLTQGATCVWLTMWLEVQKNPLTWMFMVSHNGLTFTFTC